MMNTFKRTALIGCAMGAVLGLTACDSNDSTPAMRNYTVSVTNVTANQPLSPVAVQLSDMAYHAWSIGAPATTGLEDLAESGSPVMFLEEGAQSSVAETMGSAPIGPGGTASFTLSALASDSHMLTVATMLVNTNDAFTGLTGMELGGMAVGDSMKRVTPIYDAGTEANSETAETVPGPAAGGEGYNSARDDTNYVTRHGGVVTADDGLATSVLNQSHRFDNGAMLVTITRTE